MKNIALLISILLFLASAFLASAFDVQALQSLSGPATINLTASFQVGGQYTQISSQTNHTTTTTNIVTIYKSTVTNLVVNDAYLLDLLANSYKTNFPAGARLFLVDSKPLNGNFSFHVTDSSGTNIILSPSTNVIGLNIFLAPYQLNGMETLIVSHTKSGTTVSGNDTELFANVAFLIYNDITLTTRDGTHSDFSCVGMLTDKFSQNYAIDKKTKALISLSGAGNGTIHNGTCLIEGTLAATLSGFAPY